MGLCTSKDPERTVKLAGALPPPDIKVKAVRFREDNRALGNNTSVPLDVTKLQMWPVENGKQHRTKKFSLAKTGTLVIRRGQPFKMTLTFNRPYNSLSDELKFYFETGEKPKPANDTMVCLSSYKTAGSSGWKADFLPEVDPEGECLLADLWIYTPPHCIIGEWKFSMQSTLHTDTDTKTSGYSHPDKLYILFNPWCQDDAVFLPNEQLLTEYIINPSGITFQGTRRELIVKPWVYGQFEPGVLEACVYIIRRSFNFVTSPAMADPVQVARNLTMILNAEGDNGVLQGRWFTNNFRGGRPPTSWSGSVAILKKYVDSAIRSENGKPTPVRFGQCFVFSGLMVTICRAIGIPCRSVTNFNSGRDNDGTLAIDFNYEMTKDGLEEIKPTNHDFVLRHFHHQGYIMAGTSTWWRGMNHLAFGKNFHVWNDVWMARRDLKPPYNGADWQAVDATPQVASKNGVHCCGPAPLKAIKDGAFTSSYDVGFIYSEVNADVLHWLKLGKNVWSVFKTEARVGQCISTKKPDGQAVASRRVFSSEELDNIRQDITEQYKHPEGSQQEREVARKANRHTRPPHPCSAKDVDFTFGEIASVNIGDTFNVSVTVRSGSEETRSLRIFIFCEATFYNGKRDNVVKQINYSEPLEPHANSSYTLEVTEEDYLNKLSEHMFMKAYVLVRVVETGQVEASIEHFVFRKPNLVLEPEGPITKGEHFDMKVTFQNPLHRPLTKCLVSVEGVGVYNVEKISRIDDIPPRCIWTGLITLLPLRSKTLQVSATLHCNELLDLKGCTAITVAKAADKQQQA